MFNTSLTFCQPSGAEDLCLRRCFQSHVCWQTISLVTLAIFYTDMLQLIKRKVQQRQTSSASRLSHPMHSSPFHEETLPLLEMATAATCALPGRTLTSTLPMPAAFALLSASPCNYRSRVSRSCYGPRRKDVNESTRARNLPTPSVSRYHGE